VWATAISSDGAQMVTGHDDGSVHGWDLATEAKLRTIKIDGPVRTTAFAPGRHDVAVGTRTGVLGIWNTDNGESVIKFDGHKGIIMRVAFSHDGTLLASVGGDKTARLWTVATGRERLQLEGHNGGIYGVSFSADDRLIATGGWDKVVRVWDVAAGKPLGALEGHTSDIWAVAFAPKGNLLASVGEDRDVRLWDAKTLQPLPRLVGHTGMLCTLAFNESGKLATAGRDGTARIWNVQEFEGAP
jgi:WD40 repeat protein